MGIRAALGLTKTRSQTRSARLGTEPRVVPERVAELSIWGRVPGIILAVGALALLVLFLTDARFRVEAVAIQGVENLTVEQLRSELSIEGRSIFRVNTARSEEALRAAFPTLEQVRVTRTLPQQVVITVRESDVVMVWESGGRHWWVGASGKLYGETHGSDGLPLVHDVEGIIPEPEGYLPLVPVELVQALGGCMPVQQAYDYTPNAGLLIYASTNQVPVMLGHDGNGCRKIAVLQSLLSSLGSKAEDVRYIDLRNEDRPVYNLN